MLTGSLANIHHGKSELLLIATSSKLSNDDMQWAPSGVLGPSLMFIVGGRSCLLLHVVSSATITYGGGLCRVSFMCKWVSRLSWLGFCRFSI